MLAVWTYQLETELQDRLNSFPCSCAIDAQNARCKPLPMPIVTERMLNMPRIESPKSAKTKYLQKGLLEPKWLRTKPPFGVTNRRFGRYNLPRHIISVFMYSQTQRSNLPLGTEKCQLFIFVASKTKTIDAILTLYLTSKISSPQTPS